MIPLELLLEIEPEELDEDEVEPLLEVVEVVHMRVVKSQVIPEQHIN